MCCVYSANIVFVSVKIRFVLCLFIIDTYHKTFVRTSQKAIYCHLLSLSPFKCMSASLCHHSLMKVAVCYRNDGITTVTFLASANESLVMSIPSHSGLFKPIDTYRSIIQLMGTYTNSVAGHVKQLTSGLKRLKYPSSSELPNTSHGTCTFGSCTYMPPL